MLIIYGLYGVNGPRLGLITGIQLGFTVTTLSGVSPVVKVHELFLLEVGHDTWSHLYVSLGVRPAVVVEVGDREP